jgi:hypothetical protein
MRLFATLARRSEAGDGAVQATPARELLRPPHGRLVHLSFGGQTGGDDD